jgi:hypothetical protein
MPGDHLGGRSYNIKISMNKKDVHTLSLIVEIDIDEKLKKKHKKTLIY